MERASVAQRIEVSEVVRVRADVIAVAVGDSLHLHYTAREYISSIRGFDKTIGLKLWKQYNFVSKITSSSLLSFVYIKEANKSGVLFLFVRRVRSGDSFSVRTNNCFFV